MTSADDLGLVADGARLLTALPYIRSELEGMEKSLISRVFGAIREKNLSPEAAYAAWLELASYRGLMHRMETRVKVAQSVGETSKNTLEGVE